MPMNGEQIQKLVHELTLAVHDSRSAQERLAEADRLMAVVERLNSMSDHDLLIRTALKQEVMDAKLEGLPCMAHAMLLSGNRTLLKWLLAVGAGILTTLLAHVFFPGVVP